jgi:hypothetical protein
MLLIGRDKRLGICGNQTRFDYFREAEIDSEAEGKDRRICQSRHGLQQAFLLYQECPGPLKSLQTHFLRVSIARPHYFP